MSAIDANPWVSERSERLHCEEAAKDILAVFMSPDDPEYDDVVTATIKRLHMLIARYEALRRQALHEPSDGLRYSRGGGGGGG